MHNVDTLFTVKPEIRRRAGPRGSLTNGPSFCARNGVHPLRQSSLGRSDEIAAWATNNEGPPIAGKGGGRGGVDGGGGGERETRGV